MKCTAQQISEQIDDPVSAAILWKLRTGRAYTAIELAKETDVAKGKIQPYLNTLIQAELLTEIERRKRGYYRLLNNNVQQALHAHYEQAGLTESELAKNHHPTGMKYCRTCYNHLAGKVGVMVTKALMQKGIIKIGEDTHFVLLPEGELFFEEWGIDIVVLRKKRSRFAKACIDFSERKYHLGGALGKAFFCEMEQKGWVQRIEGAREVTITTKGRKAFTESFHIEL